ncbi:MAG: YegS/Rv2252/BmrU family lipid kinase [Clostridiales bacterium]|nr:YegS/Rv2252/BmrU family lipid kinase [Clostridiales bacterium]
MKQLLFVYNPQAGKGQIKGRLAGVLDVFASAGYLTVVYPTQGPGEATSIVAELAPNYELVVCSGGDGTLNEVVSGLMQLESPPPLGYIPAGSTNDFARNLSLPQGMENAARTAIAGVPRPCDVGRFNGRPFIYVAAFGAFTGVAYDTPQEVKNVFGHMAYLVEGVGRLGSLKSCAITVEHEGGMLDGDFLYGMVSNTVSVGGFKSLVPGHVQLDDGLFEVLLVRQPASIAEIQKILMSLTVQKPTTEGPVIAFRASHLRITCEEKVPWTLDGEYGGEPGEIIIENCRRAITILHGE